MVGFKPSPVYPYLLTRHNKAKIYIFYHIGLSLVILIKITRDFTVTIKIFSRLSGGSVLSCIYQSKSRHESTPGNTSPTVVSHCAATLFCPWWSQSDARRFNQYSVLLKRADLYYILLVIKTILYAFSWNISNCNMQIKPILFFTMKDKPCIISLSCDSIYIFHWNFSSYWYVLVFRY